ncbi:flagellar hook-basal body protein [Sporosalibacterium faouarense]|uniref:flagellar hook-basal body protein n=1 Tax=Sporosalibacterium faouarense TaxID=516123 RepID=UPI00141C7EC9|nr:flagellar hook-basal body protein [Sporosalibacterium faouarense]MTI46853.1 flagellar hook-basal body protein [Bacillota bacterium]
MNNGLYSSTTALLLNQKRLDAVSNNIANINTTGYKKDVVISQSFPEVLLSKINDGLSGNRTTPFKGVEVTQNGDVYSLSINSGYFKIETPEGISHNREMNFVVDDDGYLRTYFKDNNGKIKTQGENYVLGQNGRIRVEDSNIEITQDGRVVSNGQVMDNLVSFPLPNVIGTTSGGVRLDRVATNFIQGDLRQTGNQLDFALKGDGFFKVHTPQGDMYTRDGSFTLNENGELITTEGYFVLGQYGSIVAEGDDFTINEKGQIINNGEAIDSLDIVTLDNIEDLRKQGNNLYKLEEGVEPQESEFNGQVIRGYLEGSNVDTIKEMVKMITLMRNYESNQKIIRSHDEMLGKAINEIAKI